MKQNPQCRIPELCMADDSAFIQALVDRAGSGGTVTIGINPRTGDQSWEVRNAIMLPSDITVVIDGATVKLGDGAFCNVFCSSGAYDSSMAAGDVRKNIKIIGRGGATLDGGAYNGKSEATAGFPNITQNCFIVMRNVEGFEVSGLTLKNSRYWASVFWFCREGKIENITFYSANTAPNQDGIDVRIGCKNIDIKDIFGVTGDDTVALTALSHPMDRAFFVEGKDANIENITVANVNALCQGGHGVIRLLAQDGNQIKNVTIDGVYDASIAQGGPRCTQGLIRIGETGYSTLMPNVAGDIDSITVKNVISRANSAVYSGSENVTKEYLTVSNITAVEGTGFGGTLADLT